MHKFYKPFTTLKSKKEQLKIENELGGDNPVSYRSSRESMSKSVLGLRRRNIMLALAAFLLVIFSTTVYAACVTPTRGMTITEDTQFCKGTYTLTDTSNNIKVRGDNIVVDCNGATIQGDFKTKFTTGFSLVGNGITLKNCNIQGYSTCISLTNYGVNPTQLMKNSKIISNNLTRCDGLAGIFIDGQSNFDISKNRFVNFNDYQERDIGSHAIYLSSYDQNQAAQSGKIYNNYIYDMSATGIKIYGMGTTRNIQIYQNTISKLTVSQTDDIGVHLEDVDNISVHDNDFIGNYARGVLLNEGIDGGKAAKNSNIYNNNFEDIDIVLEARDGTQNNKFYNNNIHSTKITEYRIFSSTNNKITDNGYYLQRMNLQIKYLQNAIEFNENTNTEFVIEQSFNNAYVNLKYNGVKSFNYKDGTITFSFVKPYNDVKDLSTGKILSSNTNSYSIKLSSNQQIEVGNFVADPVNQQPAVSSVTISSSDNTVNSDVTCSGHISDSDTTYLKVYVQWYKNNLAYKMDTLNNQKAGTTISQTLSKTELTAGDTWSCRIKANDGQTDSQWTNSNTITINNPPSTQIPIVSSVSISSSDNTVNSDVTCSGHISDSDTTYLKVYVQWYKNNLAYKMDTLNNQKAGTTISQTLSKTELTAGDTWSCRIKANDGQTDSQWTNSNTITITNTPTNSLPVINSITAYSYDSTINNDVLCLLNIDDSNDDPMTVTLHWYKNGAFFKSVTKYNQHPGEITEPLTKDNLAVGDSWQCRSRLYDGKNYSSWKQSNTISIQQIPVPNEEEPEEKPRKSGGGGGGGGSGYSPPVVVEEPVVEEPIIEEPVIEEPVVEELNVYNDEQVEITAQSANVEEPVNIETDLITGDVVLETDNPGNGLWLFFGVMISGILLFINRKQVVIATSRAAPVVEKQFLAVKAKFLVKPNQQIIYYMLKKLNDGYSYEAIAEVLKKKGYKDRIIDHHVKILQSEGHQPHIRYPGPQKYHIPASKKAKLISDIQEYTRIHIHEGFRLDDIKAVLLYSGHPYDLIEEAIHG